MHTGMDVPVSRVEAVIGIKIGLAQRGGRIEALTQEGRDMAFKNEKISEQDREWVVKLVNYENIRAISHGVHGVHRFRLSTYWTANHERNVYLISLGGGGTPDDIGRMPYAILILDGQVVVFNVIERWTGNNAAGIHLEYQIHNLVAPPAFDLRRDEIKEVLREAYEEFAYCNPAADGGTAANPNMTARWNIKSVNVEFK